MTQLSILHRTLGAALPLTALVVLAGCASRPAPPPSPTAAPTAPAAARVRAPRRSAQEEIAALIPNGVVDVALPPQPLPQLINTVFGDILKVPYVVGPDVAVRTDIVALRSAPQMSRRDLYRFVQQALKTYGVSAYIRDGVVTIVTDNAQNGPPALLLGARADAQAQVAEQTTSQVYAVKLIDVGTLAPLLTDLFPETRNVSFVQDAAANSLQVTGAPRDVAAAVSILRQLDQPQFSGSSVFRYQPVYWSADTFARMLGDALSAEGLKMRDTAGSPSAVLILPFASSGQILVFAKDPAVLQHARTWIDRLDQASAVPGGGGGFIYQARNTDAASLVALVADSDPATQAARGLPAGVPGAPPANAVRTSAGLALLSSNPSSGGTFGGGRLIVDPAGNRILFTGSADDYTRLRSLLVALDTPLKEVLVEVTIAEVTLTKDTQLGLEWFFQHSMGGGVLSGGTKGGLGLGKNGLNLTFDRQDLNVQFNAFADNNNVNILSRPRLVARSGREASFQVGTDVPIITSQINSPTTTSGTTGILQTIQYRQTGIILHIKPTIYGEDRVNLEITQEVSSEQNNPNVAIGSPLILDRNVTTELSLADGATAVLGGLMENDYTNGNSGVPVLKDVPLIGEAFKTNTLAGTKTELVMLVTPHILHENEDTTRWADRLSAEMNSAMRTGTGLIFTLTPFGHGKEFQLHPSAPVGAAQPPGG
jgi:general secretion pathway protein D